VFCVRLQQPWEKCSCARLLGCRRLAQHPQQGSAVLAQALVRDSGRIAGDEGLDVGQGSLLLIDWVYHVQQREDIQRMSYNINEWPEVPIACISRILGSSAQAFALFVT
jgi:hypothetical protein